MKKIRILTGTLLAILIVGAFLYAQFEQEKKIQKLFSEYPHLRNSDDIYGRITRIYEPPKEVTNKNPFVLQLVINDSIKISIDVGWELITRKKLVEVLSEGYFMQKGSGSDTLKIIGGTGITERIYLFTLSDRGN